MTMGNVKIEQFVKERDKKDLIRSLKDPKIQRVAVGIPDKHNYYHLYDKEMYMVRLRFLLKERYCNLTPLHY